MAYFKKRPGSAGDWSQDDNTLTLHLGEIAEIILWGGGPPGQEKLNLSFAPNTICTGGEDIRTPLGPDERLVKLTPTAVGEVWIWAKIGNNQGPDYSKPCKVVILPARPSSIGPEHVIVYSGKGSETIQEAYNKTRGSASAALVYGANSPDAFVSLLAKYRDAGRQIAKLECNTHGAPGFIFFGGVPMGARYLRDIAGRGFDAALAPGVHIFCHGCNVAEGNQGNDFLLAFGETLLRRGGIVSASTSVGLGTGNWGNGKVYHLWGDTKRVIVGRGGQVVEKINFDA